MEPCPSLPSIGGICSSLVNYDNSYYVLFGLTQRGYMNSIIRFKLNEQHIERDRRRTQHFSRMQATFFDSESNLSSGAPPE